MKIAIKPAPPSLRKEGQPPSLPPGGGEGVGFKI